MNEKKILKRAVLAAYRVGPFLPGTINGTVRIPFLAYNGFCHLIYNCEEEEIVAIETPDGPIPLT